jgi:hypothetical protein
MIIYKATGVPVKILKDNKFWFVIQYGENSITTCTITDLLWLN